MTPPIFCITGASGFVGTHLRERISKQNLGQIRALSRSPQSSHHAGETWFQSDLLSDASSLAEWLVEDSTLVHLAYAGKNEPAVISKLHEAAHRAGVKRVIFCTTAMVVGRTSESIIDESTKLSPSSAYELEKKAVEDAIFTKNWEMPVVILRPTAVFGPGGKNLIFAMPGFYANDWRDRLRRFGFGRRKMHLVSVHNVVEAVIHLNQVSPDRLESIYQVTDDESRLSCFSEVYREFLRFRAGGKTVPGVSGYFLPKFALGWVLRLSGRSLANPATQFTQKRLLGTGFQPVVPLEVSLQEFFRWYDSNLR